MSDLFLVRTDSETSKKILSDFFIDLDPDGEIQTISVTDFAFQSSSFKLKPIVSSSLGSLIVDSGTNVEILIAIRLSSLALKTFDKLNRRKKNYCLSLADALIYLSYAGDPSLREEIVSEFEDMDSTSKETIHEYIKCDKNILFACESLHIHRNTFTKREERILNKYRFDLKNDDHLSLFHLAEILS